MADVDTETIELAGLTERQRNGLIEVLDEVRHADGWSWQLPVCCGNAAGCGCLDSSPSCIASSPGRTG